MDFTTGYVSGGSTADSAFSSGVDRFDFSNNVVASSVGNLGNDISSGAGVSNATNGYVASGLAGRDKEWGLRVGNKLESRIHVFNLGTAISSSSHGKLNQAKTGMLGVSGPTAGYVMNGITDVTYSKEIERLNYSTLTTRNSIYDLRVKNWFDRKFSEVIGKTDISRNECAGHESTTHGFISGGCNSDMGGGYCDAIEKFPWGTSITTTLHGELTVGKWFSCGHSNYNKGYTSSGIDGYARNDSICRFYFDVENKEYDHGNLTTSRDFPAPCYSNMFGYTCGGFMGGNSTMLNIIDRYNFTHNIKAIDHGDLSNFRSDANGHQNGNNSIR
jgi:hypothetical protein